MGVASRASSTIFPLLSQGRGKGTSGRGRGHNFSRVRHSKILIFLGQDIKNVFTRYGLSLRLLALCNKCNMYPGDSCELVNISSKHHALKSDCKLSHLVRLRYECEC